MGPGPGTAARVFPSKLRQGIEALHPWSLLLVMNLPLQAWELIVTTGVFTLLVWIAMSCQCLLIGCLVLYSDMLSALQAATMQRTKEVVIDKLRTMEGEFIVADPFIEVAHINRNSWDPNCCQLGLLCPTALKVQKDCADLEQFEGGYCHELSSERKGQTWQLAAPAFETRSTAQQLKLLCAV